MEGRSLFSFKSYRSALAAELTGDGKRGRLTQAAAYMSCQRSYLSRVLGGELHLTPEHAFKLAAFLQLSADQRDYLIALLEVERAGSPEYRNHWKAKADELKRKHDSIE